MKRLLPKVFLFFCFSVFLFTPRSQVQLGEVGFFSFSVFQIHAQTFDFNRAYQDYAYNYNLYRESYLNFIAAKGESARYQTLTAQTRALEVTRTMLKARAEALRTYLTALRLRLMETPGVPSDQQNVSYLKIDTEVNWLATHKDLLSSPSSISDLLKVSSILQQRYPGIELLSYQVLSAVLSGRENNLREKALRETDRVEEKTNQMRSEGENVDKLDRWLLEARKKIILSEEKQAEAENLLKSTKESSREKRKIFNQVQFIYEESNQYLKEAVSYLSEIVNEIKYE